MHLGAECFGINRSWKLNVGVKHSWKLEGGDYRYGMDVGDYLDVAGAGRRRMKSVSN
jgi:hypothetical protein